MSDKRISELVELTSLAADDELVVVDADANGTKRITSANLLKTGIVGQVSFFAQNTAPTGWLKANGATVSRTTYADLFAAIGTTFGTGDGSTTFGLPDLRGEFPRGWDDGRGVDSGRSFGSAQADEFKSHEHRLIERDGSGGAFDADVAGTASSFTSLRDDAMLPEGGSETRPRNIALLACIKF